MATKASAWKSKARTGEHELTLPSGNSALCRGIKPEAFLEAGIIPEPMMAILQKAINSKKGMRPQAINDIAGDPKKLAQALELFDRALVYCVVEPEVELPPICLYVDMEGKTGACGLLYTGGDGIHVDKKHAKYHKFIEADRDPDVLYADVVDLEDKQFIFQWAVGGSADLREFRRELAKTVGTVQRGQGVRVPAKSTVGDQ
jgi:hypothetical protein